MKKRILAMLLLVATVVTALPLLVLPSLAAEQETEANTYTEADYNALYAQDGLLLAFDAMVLNEYWGEAADARAEFPVSPMLNNNYDHNGTKYDFTKKYVDADGVVYPYYPDRWTTKSGTEEYYVVRATRSADSATGYSAHQNQSGPFATLAEAKAEVDKLEGEDAKDQYEYLITGYTQSDAYKAAGKAYYTAANAWLAKYVWKTAVYKNTSNRDETSAIKTGTNASTGSNVSNLRRDGHFVHAIFETPVAGEGYLTTQYPFCGDQGFQLSLPAAGAAGLSMEMVTRLGSLPSSNFVIFSNLRPVVSSGKITGMGTYGSKVQRFVVDGEATAEATLNRTAIDTIRFTLVNNEEAAKDTVLLTQGDAILYSATGTYDPQSASSAATGILGYSNSYRGGETYAFRAYDHALSDAEAAQNHFADIAKWFKIDLSLLEMVSGADMPILYAAFAGFTLESDKAAVEAALAGTVKQLVEDKYAGTVAEQYAALAVKHGLDLSPLIANPLGMLSNTLAFLNGITDESENVKAGYEAALALDTASPWTEKQYNALYVQEGLVLGFDFYETNEYWSGKQASVTGDADAAKTFVNGYVYEGSKLALGAIDLSPDNGTVVAKDGYLSLGMFYQLAPASFSSSCGYGVDYLTSESVRTYTATSVVANLFGLRIDAYVSGDFNEIKNGSASIIPSAGFDASNALGAKNLSDLSKVATYTAIARRDAITHANSETTITEYQAWNSSGKQIGYALLCDIYHAPAEGEETVIDLRDPLYTIEANGETVKCATTKGGAQENRKVLNLRTYPATAITPDYVINAAGEKVANAEGKQYWVAVAAERFVKGEAHIWQNGQKKYENTDLDYVNSKYYNSNDDYIVLWGQSGSSSAANPGKLYAGRYYNRALTEAEMAQNHFADIAKYFRLNVAGIETLSAESKAAVYASVAAMTFENTTKNEAQAAVNAVLNAAAEKAYDAMKDTYPEIPAAFFDIAAAYRLDLSAVLAAERNMASVYELSFAGLSCAAAQALLDEGYLDAYEYLSYQNGNEALDGLLAAIAATSNGTARLAIEDLMALPTADRIAFATEYADDLAAAESIAAAQGIVDAYVTVKMAQYNRTAAEYDYDALYTAQDAALLSLDFFKTNEYWNEDMGMPIACEDTDGYEYNGKTYNFKSNPEERFFSAAEKWAVKRSDGNFVYYTKAGKLAATKSPYPNGVADATIPGQVVMPLQAFTTKEEAEAVKAAAAAYWTSYTYEIVELPLYIVYRETIAKGEFGAYGEKKADGKIVATYGTSKATVAFMTEELAAAKAAELAGATYAEGTTSYTDAAGTYRYFTALRPVISAPYYWCCQDYITSALAVFNDLRLDDQSVVGTNLLLPTIGELSYHSRNGEDMYGPFVYENGYAEIDPHHSGAYMNFSKAPATGELYLDALMAGGEMNATGNIAFAFRSAYFKFDSDESGIAFSGISGYTNSNIPNTSATASHKVAKGEAFRLSIESNATASAATYLTKVNGVTVLDGSEISGTGFNTGLLAYTAKADTRFYTFRIYNRYLTDAEKAQNAFADLAKWYKLDLGLYLTLSAEDQAKVWAEMAAYTVDSAPRAEVQDALNAAAAKCAYAGVTVYADAEKNEKFMLLAAVAALDLSPIKMLTADTREAFCDSVLMNEFDPAYAINGDVIYTLYDNATFSLAAMTFAGYQVRLDTGASLANYAGVRAVFDIDEARIAEIIERNNGAAVTLTISVTGAATQEIVFVYTMEEGALTCKTDALIYDRAGGKSANYTVTYQGDKFTAENLEAEFAYGYSIKVGNAAAINFAVDTVTFGATVSAAEVYGYFAENGYADDRMVADVMTLLAD